MMNPFLFTKDRSVAMSLKKRGYQIVSQTGDGWTFMNKELDSESSNMSLSEFDKNVVIETDKLFI